MGYLDMGNTMPMGDFAAMEGVNRTEQVVKLQELEQRFANRFAKLAGVGIVQPVTPASMPF
jgi:hypothetical protein